MTVLMLLLVGTLSYFVLHVLSIRSMLEPTPCDGYKLFEVNNDIARFSFEYPCNWKSSRVEIITDRYIGLSLHLYGPRIKIDDSYVYSVYFSISLHQLSEEYPDATTALINHLTTWDRISEEFQMQERSTIEIAGLEAEQATYFDTVPTDLYGRTDPAPTLVRECFFEYGGYIWNLHYQSILSIAEENEVYLNHILETFKILN